MTTTTPEPAQDRLQERITAAMAGLTSDMARTDSKASMLLALTGAALAAVLSVGATLHPPAIATVTGVAGAVALLAATVILLIAVRPTLGGPGWTNWPNLSRPEVHDQLTAGIEVRQVQFVAALAVRKFRYIRLAVDCILVGIALLVVTTLILAVT